MHYDAFVDVLTDPLAAAIGTRVKQERHARRWTLDQLAEAAAVSRRLLVTIEHGVANPSIGTLLKISDALGVGLPALVEPPSPSHVRVTRRGDGAVLWRGEAGGCALLVAGTGPPDVVELWDWTLGAGDRHVSQPHTAGTRELLHVLRGTVTVELADQELALATGDAVTFAGDIAHAYTNPSRRSARFSLAVFEPRVGTASLSENANVQPR